MMRSHPTTTILAMSLGVLALLAASALRGDAADHGDAPLISNDQAADIGDVYFFLDPNDNSQVILAMDVRGFIAAGENANFGFFDHTVRFRFSIENTGDAIPDMFIDVTFSRQTAKNVGQTATVQLSTGQTFTAPATISSTAFTPPAQVITTDPATGIKFFAGMVDDPFFFDIPAFGRFIASVNAGMPDVSVFNRKRDSFAGYNIMMIVMSVPKALIQGPAGPSGTVGLYGATQRRQRVVRDNTLAGAEALDPRIPGTFVNVDRQGLPAVNIVFIRNLARKDEYNRATPLDDAQGAFAADIVATATALGTNGANIALLASLAVANGDILRLNLGTPNSSLGGPGSTPGPPGFPNGRRPADDVIDIELAIVTNGALTTGDGVDANEKPFQATFPFFALPHQPLPNTGDVDPTQN